MEEPNYTKCSLDELLDVERNIEKEKYPERYAEVLRQIELRKKGVGPQYPSYLTPSTVHAEVSPYYKYHTFWRRFFAILLDGLILTPVLLLIGFGAANASSLLVEFLWLAIYSSTGLVYTIGMHSFCGQTIGKMITGVTVLSLDETKLSFKQACFRDILPILIWSVNLYVYYLVAFSNLPEEEIVEKLTYVILATYVLLVWGVLELITMLFHKKRRAIHDFIAGSVVVKNR